MLQNFVIGNLGADAEVRNKDGQEFVVFRVAHNESYTDASGQKKEKSMWIDCTMSCTSGRPAVLPYLLSGTLVAVFGSASLRTYSSEKDRCIKAGMTIRVQRVELLGGASDVIPRRLYTSDGIMVDVTKFYHVDSKETELMDIKGKRFLVDANGWVTPKPAENEDKVF